MTVFIRKEFEYFLKCEKTSDEREKNIKSLSIFTEAC